MSDKEEQPPEKGADLDRPDRPHRKFTVADALGRSGADLLKGTSPVTQKRQADLEIQEALLRNLADADGALRVVLQRTVRESEILLRSGYEQPLTAVAEVTRLLLSSEARLETFVRAVDGEWGRIYGERPHFERQGRPADRDDPYTWESVRAALTQLLERLGSLDA